MSNEGSDPFEEEPQKPKAPPPKRSLFAFRKPKKRAPEGEAVDFFSRSKELFPKRLEEEEKRRQKKAVKLERKRNSESAEKQATPEEKRPRMSKSLYSSDEEIPRTRKESTHSTPGSRISHTTPQPERPQAHKAKGEGSSSQGLQNSTSNNSARNNAIISLSDSEDDVDKVVPAARNLGPYAHILQDDDDLYVTKSRPVQVPDEMDQMSDEEFPELIQAAAERARLKEAAKLKSSQAFLQQNHQDDDDIFGLKEDIPNPVVEILISSEIEGSIPLMVKRRLLARLKEVKFVWCDKQVINGVNVFSSDEAKDVVFLTYKKKRLFDATTCHSLGLKLHPTGHLEDGPGVREGKVHLEAWTDETYDIYQKREARRIQNEKEGIEVEEESEHPEVKENRMKLIMKSKAHGEHRLKAASTTPIAKLIDAFRKVKSIPEYTNISLKLEGDTLEPDSLLGDADLEEDEEVVFIEVYIG
ncbi:hypothetical protein HYALB_00006566 [Hymenoscyphus albidus]|uniref:Rad60/SUMO-like domain-containing protein n=1 Tax=Hymenoscyphus albidus TaxID=595503 RepID=A0A9N9LXJ3_9HELO|nr:hypothetical protein HYALB_00006566 [Hymenoscyphus albidus]